MLERLTDIIQSEASDPIMMIATLFSIYYLM